MKKGSPRSEICGVCCTLVKNRNENTHGRCMAAVMLEVVLSGADFHDTPRQDRRLGCGHREARRRHIAGPIVPLHDHRAPAPQPLQVDRPGKLPIVETEEVIECYTRKTQRALRPCARSSQKGKSGQFGQEAYRTTPSYILHQGPNGGGPLEPFGRGTIG